MLDGLGERQPSAKAAGVADGTDRLGAVTGAIGVAPVLRALDADGSHQLVLQLETLQLLAGHLAPLLLRGAPQQTVGCQAPTQQPALTIGGHRRILLAVEGGATPDDVADLLRAVAKQAISTPNTLFRGLSVVCGTPTGTPQGSNA